MDKGCGNIMLTFERILEVFADYLAADPDVEVILTRHGYIYLVWDDAHHSWENCEACATPEELLDALTDAVQTFEAMHLLKGRREPTDAETAAFAQTAEAYRRKCLERQD